MFKTEKLVLCWNVQVSQLHFFVVIIVHYAEQDNINI